MIYLFLFFICFGCSVFVVERYLYFNDRALISILLISFAIALIPYELSNTIASGICAGTSVGIFIKRFLARDKY